MIYRLEDRVLFEAAAAVEAAYADEAQNQTDNAEQTEGAEQSEAEKYAAAAGPGPDNNADSSSAASCPGAAGPAQDGPDAEQSGDTELILIFGDAEGADQLAEQAGDNVIVIRFDGDETGAEVLDRIAEALDGRTVDRAVIVSAAEADSDFRDGLQAHLGENAEVDVLNPGSESYSDEFAALMEDFSAEQDDGEEQVRFAPETEQESESGRRELVIIGSEVKDADKIAAEFGDNTDVLYLDGDRSALDQINEFLDNADDQYDAIRIFSHGNAGYLYLNGEVIDSDYVAENRDAFAAIGEHITENGDLLLYSCNLAENDAGKALVYQLADITGADVAASVDSTGIGGDWDLEYTAGPIESVNISVGDYGHSLVAVSNQTELQTALTGGAGSITIANDFDIDTTITVSADVDIDGGNYTLTWTGAAGGTMFNIGANLTVTVSSLTLDGGTVYEADGTVAAGNGGARIMNVGANTAVTLTGITMHNGYAAGNGGAVNAAAGSTLVISGGDYSGNYATGRGGAIYSAGGIDVQGNGTGFTGNRAGGGGAIAIAGASSSLTISGDNTVFRDNQAGAAPETGGEGGAINISGGATLTISGTGTVISGNRGMGYGGAVYSGSAADTILISGDSTRFLNNEAFRHKNGLGGAIFFAGNLTITGSDILFQGNKSVTAADADGGAISGQPGSVLYIDAPNIKFIGNQANNYGGAIYTQGVITITAASKALFHQNQIVGVTFGSNGGGAIYVTQRNADPQLVSSIENVTFTQNSVSNGGVGGAVLLHGAYLKITECIFTENTATSYGGAIGVGYWSASQNWGKAEVIDSTFTGNSANYGGAISSYGSYKGYGEVSVTGSTFTGNTAANSGGAIYHTSAREFILVDSTFTQNRANGASASYGGGAIYTNKAMTVKESTFSGNSATNGGVIFATGSAAVVTLDGATLGGSVADANSAVTGGGVYLTSGAGLNMVNGSVISHNSASSGGGVAVVTTSTFSSYTSTITSDSTSSIHSNSATGSGGGIYASGPKLTLVLDGVTLGGAAGKGNTARDGGGIALASATVLSIDDTSVISHNAATGNGGGIHVASGLGLTLADGFNINSNTAQYGGGIYMVSGALAITGPGTFSGNTASISGGGIYSSAGTVSLAGSGSGLVFTGNIAKGTGTDTGGGAVYHKGAMTVTGNVQFIGNKAHAGAQVQTGTDRYGYAIYNWGGSGGAIFSAGSLTIRDGDVLFEGNVAAGTGYGYGGGAVFAGSGVNLSGKVTFRDNLATADASTRVDTIRRTIFGTNIDTAVYSTGGDGGAIYLAGGSLKIDAADADSIVFDGNIAKGRNGGGAVYMAVSTSTTITGTGEVLFTRNGAPDDPSDYSVGGAFFCDRSTVLTITNSNTAFIENYAENFAGAIHSYSNVTIHGEAGNYILFKGNYVLGNNSVRTGGGAIEIQQGVLDARYVRFEGNSVYKTSASTSYEAYGGAVFIWSNYFGPSYIDHCEFVDNSAQFGGALYVGWRHDQFTGQGNVIVSESVFDGNRAVALMRNTSTGVITENTSLAADGGAIGLGTGGSVSDCASAGKLTLSGENTFTNNLAISAKTGRGGAIFVSWNEYKHLNSNLTTTRIMTCGELIFADGANTVFTGNEATDGGAIYLQTTGVLTLGGGAVYTFTDNAASRNGGAIYFDVAASGEAEKTLTGMTFTDNTAGSDGGAIYSARAFTVSGAAVFNGNNAGASGGAIYATGAAAVVTLDGVTIGGFDAVNNVGLGNSAKYGGGVALAAGAKLAMVNNAVISYNTASSDGGGIHAAAGTTLTLTSGSVSNNAANGGNGGGIWTATSVTIDSALTLANNAALAGYGGAIYGSGSAAITLDGALIGGAAATANSAKFGGGVALADTAALTLLNSAVISHNTATDGGGIYASAGTGLTLTSGRVTNNAATGNGGGIYVGNGAEVNLTDTSVSHNSVSGSTSGGGGIIVAGGAVTITGASHIDGNTVANTAGSTAETGGGALLLKSGSVTISGTTTLSNNVANNGSAIKTYGGVLTVGGNTGDHIVIDGNTNGGGHQWGAALLLEAGSGTIADAEISNNVNSHASGMGGGILVGKNMGAFTVSDTKIHHNTAAGGGGIYINDNGNLSFGDNVKIYSNVAKANNNSQGRGGGININNQGSLIIDGVKGLEIYDNVSEATLTDGDPIGGGGIYVLDSALSITNSEASIYGNSAINGGGVFACRNSVVTLDGVLIYQNSAVDGGGVFVNAGRDGTYGCNGGALTLSGETKIYENTASNHGAGLYVHANTVGVGTATITGDVQIYDNVASGSGGGIYVSSLAVLTVDGTDTAVRGNSAANGGGLHISAGSVVTFGTVSIAGNTATTGDGGGIWTAESLTIGTISRSLRTARPTVWEAASTPPVPV
ncbi:DUF4347 domain-containing protein [Victivallis vadensis]|uniref:DUF4347 domain-containing protein n=1 Tax=Victivallis vadensis TaxID=172901 RepID=UPI0023F631AF|nr:DUF4347 domain-containing protein [Victivallis vadensis]